AGNGELERIVAELSALETSLNLLEIELRRGDPRLAEITAPPVLAPEEMQARLDEDTVLLQYALGPSTSYVWAVTRESIVAVPLADQATIDAAARRALTDLQAYSPETA